MLILPAGLSQPFHYTCEHAYTSTQSCGLLLGVNSCPLADLLILNGKQQYASEKGMSTV